MPAMPTDATRPPTAEIIAAGTELTSGQKLDTNSRWLAGRLGDAGIETRFHTTVGDSLDDNVAAIRTAAGRCDVVLMTGGLGPTLDDLTREALARVVEQPLELDADALTTLEKFFAGRGREMPERNRSQVMRPRGAELLPNPVGTAPGLFASVPRGDRSPALFAAMPGVPAEMHVMFEQQVVPRLPTRSAFRSLRLLHCYGIGESATEEVLGDLTARGRNPEVGITASAATITLRILGTGGTFEEADRLAEAAEVEARRLLGKVVFGVGEETLESTLLQRLRDRGETLCSAEVGSGGVVSQRLAAVPNAEAAFRGAVVTPRNRSDELLGLPGGPPFDAVTPDHAEALAAEVRTRLKTTFAVSVVADPDQLTASVSPEDAVAYVAAAGPDWVTSANVTLLGNPGIHHARLAKTALNLLRLRLRD